jgi:thiol-disulfide isomerase/thioredoxin
MRAFLLGAVALLYPLTSEHVPAPLKPPVIESLSQRAPLFEYRSLNGNVHRLSELKGKVVVIDFWGTWCPGCVEEMPTLQRLYEEYRSNPRVAFVIVSQNDTPAKVKAFVEKNHLTMPIYYIGSNQPPKPLAPSAWPATYFVSPDGMLRGVHLGGAPLVRSLRAEIYRTLRPWKTCPTIQVGQSCTGTDGGRARPKAANRARSQAAEVKIRVRFLVTSQPSDLRR